MNIDWSALFGLQAGPAEMFIRGTAIYWFIFVLLRLAGRRDIGSLGVADLLVLLLVADAAGSAMAGQSTSITDGMFVVAALIFWSVAIDRIGFFFPAARRYLEPGRVRLIHWGALQRRGMRREFITEAELMAELRLAGLERVEQVKEAYVESDGKISIIRSPGHEAPRRHGKEDKGV
ncbi:hypothetical protein ANK1_2726 [plant metagenome]|uniref:YetF C-terminal domain-containing protein n=1 Tax=plant metagenome TaxID=1297885 RepID=A0A484QQV4_9ZZZZ